MNAVRGRWPLLATLVVSAWLSCACNTVEGVGQDVQRAGEAVEDAADRRQDERN